MNPPDATHLEAADAIFAIWLHDAAIGDSVANMSWVTDGISAQEATALGSLHNIVMSDVDLGKEVLESWIADGVSYNMRAALFQLARFASIDLELARLTARLSWIIDGVTVQELLGLQWLNAISDFDLQAAKLAAKYANGKTGALGSYLFEGLWPLVVTVDPFEELTSQSWFADGLSDEEAALVVALGRVHEFGAVYHDLLQGYFVQSKTVSLPLAGDVNIRVFQNTPFPPDEDLLAVIEDAALITEQFMREPFPSTEIILLVVDISVLPLVYPESYYGGIRAQNEEAGYVDIGVHQSSHMRLSRRAGQVESIPHEISHYYFIHPYFSMSWLREGAAQFGQAYFNHQKGIQDITDRWKEVSRLVEDLCVGLNEIENISHDVYLHGEAFKTEPCTYHMGENFLLTIFHSIGQETISSALGQLYRSRRTTEESVCRTFFRHVPHDLRGEFQDLYRRLHGGSYA